jgi:hypothetical protein
VSHRPLALVSGLTVGDYLLWNWSLNGNHDVLALVAGLTLPPLTVAWLWLFALSLARLISRAGRRSSIHAYERRQADRDARRAAGGSAQTPVAADQGPARANGSSTPSSGKLAA